MNTPKGSAAPAPSGAPTSSRMTKLSELFSICEGLRKQAFAAKTPAERMRIALLKHACESDILDIINNSNNLNRRVLPPIHDKRTVFAASPPPIHPLRLALKFIPRPKIVTICHTKNAISSQNKPAFSKSYLGYFIIFPSFPPFYRTKMVGAEGFEPSTKKMISVRKDDCGRGIDNIAKVCYTFVTFLFTKKGLFSHMKYLFVTTLAGLSTRDIILYFMP